jgi:hypothetical protein
MRKNVLLVLPIIVSLYFVSNFTSTSASELWSRKSITELLPECPVRSQGQTWTYAKGIIWVRRKRPRNFDAAAVAGTSLKYRMMRKP